VAAPSNPNKSRLEASSYLPGQLPVNAGFAERLLEVIDSGRRRRHGPRGPAIDLLPGAGDELLRLGPLMRPLVELHWTRMVAELDGVASAELNLHRHLFGSDRVLPPRALRDGIAALQGGRSFTATTRLAGPRRLITSSRGSAAASTR
jgi:hypothetical protein